MKMHERGSVLVAASWLMVLLGVFITAAARELRAHSVQAYYLQGRNESLYAAQAAVAYLTDQIARDNHDRITSRFDLSGRAGMPTGKMDFKHFPGGEESVSVMMDIYGERDSFGAGDEESKVNLNALSAQNYSILTNLLAGQGVFRDEAVELARAIVDWRDENSDSLDPADRSGEKTGGAFPPKNDYYESIEEILLVEGMAPEIFEKIAALVTVFPREGNFRINLNTAPLEVLTAVAGHFSGPSNNTSSSDARSLAEKIIRYRQGPDGISATEDDRPVELRELPLNKKEKVVAAALFAVHTPVSKHISFTVGARRRGVAVRVAAVIDRDTLSLLHWRRE